MVPSAGHGILVLTEEPLLLSHVVSTSLIHGPHYCVIFAARQKRSREAGMQSAYNLSPALVAIFGGGQIPASGNRVKKQKPIAWTGPGSGARAVAPASYRRRRFSSRSRHRPLGSIWMRLHSSVGPERGTEALLHAPATAPLAPGSIAGRSEPGRAPR